MGGALATMAAVEFSLSLKLPTRVCTFGSPRVGNNRFAELLDGVFRSCPNIIDFEIEFSGLI